MSPGNDKQREPWLRRTTGTRPGYARLQSVRPYPSEEADGLAEREQVREITEREARRHYPSPPMRDGDRQALAEFLMLLVVWPAGLFGGFDWLAKTLGLHLSLGGHLAFGAVVGGLLSAIIYVPLSRRRRRRRGDLGPNS